MFYMMKNKIAECITLIASKAISNPLRNCNIHQASLAALRRHPLPVTISNRFTSSFTIFQIFPVVSANPCPLPMDLWSQNLLRLHLAKGKQQALLLMSSPTASAACRRQFQLVTICHGFHFRSLQHLRFYGSEGWT